MPHKVEGISLSNMIQTPLDLVLHHTPVELFHLQSSAVHIYEHVHAANLRYVGK
jgi:hypothetical protein